MKIFLSFSLVLINLLSSNTCYSQIKTNQDLIIDMKSKFFYDNSQKNLVGSSYIDKNFHAAKISVDSTIYSIRFDAYQDEMEIEKDNHKFYLRKDFNYTATFLGTNKVYQVYNYEDKDQDRTGFFVVLFNGDKVSLLMKERIMFFEEVIAKSGYDKYQPPTLKRVKDKLYIGYKNNETKELPKKKNEILKLFSNKSKNIESFAKENKLGFKNKKDLIIIFTYYHTLK